MKTIATVLTIVALLTTNIESVKAVPSATEQSLALSIAPMKHVYNLNEQVQIKLALRNVSKRRILVAKTFQLTHFVDLDIRNSAGEQSKWCGRIVNQTDSIHSFIVLDPGQEVSAVLTVSCVNKGEPSRAWGYMFDTVGKYSLKAKYELPKPKRHYEALVPNAYVVRGPIESNVATFSVGRP